MILDSLLRLLAALAEAHAIRLRSMTPEQVQTETAEFQEVWNFLFGWIKKLREKDPA